MKILNTGFDHVEYIVKDIAKLSPVFSRMGFEKVGSRHLNSRGIKSELWQQGFIRILLTQSDGSKAAENDNAVKFLKEQDEGICVLALDVEDAKQAYDFVMSRGARSAMEPKTFETKDGKVTRAEIWTPGRVRYAFMSRSYPNGIKGAGLFDEGLAVTRFESPMPNHLHSIDHLTNNIDMGETQTWVDFYTKIFNFKLTRHFDIRTGRTGLTSEVVESQCGRIKVPINEATEKESQVQEFVDRLKGAGVQHLAFLTTGIMKTLPALKSQGFKFLNVPHTYYEAVPTRVPGVTENLDEVEKVGLLLDGDNTGYLLQIFSEEILGPFFFEFIQRKGNRGFGEGNFRALFEAIERDQIKRGVLKA